MITQTEALDRLIEAVEAGAALPESHIYPQYSQKRYDASGLPWGEALDGSVGDAWAAYDGSLDAAKALHEALLPGWHWAISSEPDPETAIVWRLGAGEASGLHPENPAHAWLVAILKAYRSTL